MTKKYNHAYDFAFEVISQKKNGDDVTPAMLREACIKRITNIDDIEIMQACGLFDTYKIEEKL